jgi:hypothetical protein
VKTKFLTAYDYGQGGIWRFIFAESEQQLKDQYPELTVVHEYPCWMDAEIIENLEQLALNIEDSENEFLAALRNERC